MCTVTYVDDRRSERDWQLPVPPVLALRTLDEFLSLSTPGDVLIVHGGQREGDVPTGGNRTLLVDAVMRACMGDGRAIVFSGGHPFSIRDLRRSLAAASLEEDLHFLLLPAIQNLNAEIDVKLLLKTKPEPGWRISAFRRRHALPTLFALGVLCQAALLALDPDEVYEDAAKLLGGREVMRAIRNGCASPAAVQMLSPESWRGALGVRGCHELMAAVEREWPPRAGSLRGVDDLTHIIWNDGAAPDARALSAAFVELHAALTQVQQQ